MVRKRHTRRPTKMLSQFTIIKSYLDERSKREREEKDFSRSPYVFGFFFAAWPHVLVLCWSAKKIRRRTRETKDSQFLISHAKSSFFAYGFIELSQHFRLLYSLSFFVILCWGLNEIVDNQQFVLFLFFSPVPKKKTKTSTTMTQNEDRQFLRKESKKKNAKHQKMRGDDLWEMRTERMRQSTFAFCAFECFNPCIDIEISHETVLSKFPSIIFGRFFFRVKHLLKFKFSFISISIQWEFKRSHKQHH